MFLVLRLWEQLSFWNVFCPCFLETWTSNCLFISLVLRPLGGWYLYYPFQSHPVCLLGIVQDVELLRGITGEEVAIPLTDHKPHYSSVGFVPFVLLQMRVCASAHVRVDAWGWCQVSFIIALHCLYWGRFFHWTQSFPFCLVWPACLSHGSQICLPCAGTTGSCHNCPAFYMDSEALNLSDHSCVASTLCPESSSLCYSLKNTTIISCVQFHIILLTIRFTFLLEAELLASTILKVIYNSPLSGQSTIYIIILLLILIAIINYVVVRMYCFSVFYSIFMIIRVESWGRITHSPIATCKPSSTFTNNESQFVLICISVLTGHPILWSLAFCFSRFIFRAWILYWNSFASIKIWLSTC